MNMTDAPDTPDTPTPQQKSIHTSPTLQKQASLKTMQDTHKPSPSQSEQDSTCPSCHKPIQGSVVSAMNTLWHASCFTCYKCNKTMEQEKYYQHKGHPYCYKDYKKLFSLTCDFCKKPIDTVSFAFPSYIRFYICSFQIACH